MRLAQKLSLAFFLGTTALLTVNGGLRVRREVALFQADRVRDHELMGRAVGASFAAVWRSSGQDAAVRLLDAAAAGESRVRLRWVWLDAPPEAGAAAADLTAVAEGAPSTRMVRDGRGEERRTTFVPMQLGGRPGAIELSEPLDAEERYRDRTVAETAAATAVLALITALLSYALGAWFVGRPMRALLAKARRIGTGDFDGPAVVGGADELSVLATELNAASGMLAEARERVARETASRITALEQLRHADRLTTVGKLASGVAHELGTPLNVVLARAEMIRSGEAEPAQAREYAGVIVESTRKMTRIIRQLLEMARRQPPTAARADVAAAAERTLETLRPLARKREVGLSLSKEGESFETALDAAQFDQALTNLVVNAVQASPSGARVEVSVAESVGCAPGTTGPERRWIAVRVIDQGAGIAPADVARVFEPFFTTKEVGEGTGLGLSVAHGIVEEHGGWIAVASEPGGGATFTIHLPAA